MSDMEQIVNESMRIVRAQERMAGLLRPVEEMSAMIDSILEIAPELGPELNAIRARLSESCDHVMAALSVIQAKVDLL